MKLIINNIKEFKEFQKVTNKQNKPQANRVQYGKRRRQKRKVYYDANGKMIQRGESNGKITAIGSNTFSHDGSIQNQLNQQLLKNAEEQSVLNKQKFALTNTENDESQKSIYGKLMDYTNDYVNPQLNRLQDQGYQSINRLQGIVCGLENRFNSYKNKNESIDQINENNDDNDEEDNNIDNEDEENIGVDYPDTYNVNI
jgi:hypothetical protein